LSQFAVLELFLGSFQSSFYATNYTCVFVMKNSAVFVFIFLYDNVFSYYENYKKLLKYSAKCIKA